MRALPDEAKPAGMEKYFGTDLPEWCGKLEKAIALTSKTPGCAVRDLGSGFIRVAGLGFRGSGVWEGLGRRDGGLEFGCCSGSARRWCAWRIREEEEGKDLRPKWSFGKL